MKHRLLSSLLTLTLLVGCGGNEVAQPSESDVEATAAGLAKESQIRFLLAEDLKLMSMELTPTGNGNYTATGTDGKKTSYEITIEQTPGKIEYQWTNSKGKKGKGSLNY